MTVDKKYSGHLRKDPETGKIVGVLADCWGWEISFTAEPLPEGGYKLLGVLGPTPPELRLPFVDDDDGNRIP